MQTREIRRTPAIASRNNGLVFLPKILAAEFEPIATATHQSLLSLRRALSSARVLFFSISLPIPLHLPLSSLSLSLSPAPSLSFSFFLSLSRMRTHFFFYFSSQRSPRPATTNAPDRTRNRYACDRNGRDYEKKYARFIEWTGKISDCPRAFA